MSGPLTPALPRVLIIDDIPDNVDALGETLAREYEIQCATSGPEGLALVRQHVPDLILLDVMMPEMDGYAVFAELRRDPKTRNIPVIFVTAYSDSENETRALTAGAVDFIHKPINQAVVRSRVNTQMALKRKEIELEQMNQELENRVKERTFELEERTRQVEALNIALQERAIQSEAANIAKRRFLGNMSHELRTPMNAIIGFNDLLQRKATDPGQLQKLASIGKAASHLTAIINEILHFADADTGNLNLATVDFELKDIISQVNEIIEPKALAKKLTYTSAIDPSIPPKLHGDAAKFKQVLLNLAGNAVKFTQAGVVSIRVRLIQANKLNVDIRVEVQDTGIGIDPSKLSSIFEPFEQADNSLARQFGGLGLGLSINRKLIEMMGGDIGVASEAGQGSTFWVALNFKLGKPQTANALLPPLEALKAQTPKPKLLLVDDDFITQEIFIELLNEAGLQSDTAHDGLEAVSMSRTQPYDLILMDVQMPVMDGLDATREIRTIPGREQTPIIAISGDGYDEDKNRCLKAGMNAFLAKPVLPETLYQELATWLLKTTSNTC